MSAVAVEPLLAEELEEVDDQVYVDLVFAEIVAREFAGDAVPPQDPAPDRPEPRYPAGPHSRPSEPWQRLLQAQVVVRASGQQRGPPAR